MVTKFDYSRFHSGNLALVILLLTVLGCVCSNSQRDNRKNETANSNLISKPESTPSPTHEPIPSATPSVDNLATSEVKARIEKGELIYNRIASRTGLPVMFGWRASKMSLLIPTGDWNKMTKDEQINLTYYAENLVREIRIDPALYARRWSNYYKRTEKLENGSEYDGLDESSYIEQVASLCNNCWDITLGQARRDGFYDETVPVSGADVQSFRESVQKETAKTSEETDADDFQQFASSMSAGEHLTQAEEALDEGYDPSSENFGNTELAREHIKAIPKNASEYGKAQSLLQKVIKRERERKEHQAAVFREMKRLAKGN